MRLAIPSIILLLYIVTSLIIFVPYRPLVKILVTIALFGVSLKYLLYEKIGGSFIAPDLPHSMLITLELLYSSMVILVFLLVLKDGLSLFLWFSRYLGSSWQLPFTPLSRSIGLVVAALVLGAYGTWQALRVPGVHTIEIVLEKLPVSLDGFSIVQLTDLHIGPFLKGDWLQGVVRKTNSLTPDLVAITGDMIDGFPDALMNDIAPLGELQAGYGVYGITGNHEYYFRVESWLPVFKALGITMLHNEQRTLSTEDGAKMIIAGVPDQTEKHFGGPSPDLNAALHDTADTVTILMAHRPNGLGKKVNADLQLSGHTHGGHLFFLKWLISTFNGGLGGGLYDLDDRFLYVSPGTGLWAGFSCRLGVPSEITRIILRAPGRG